VDYASYSFQSIFISWDDDDVSNSSTLSTPIRWGQVYKKTRTMNRLIMKRIGIKTLLIFTTIIGNGQERIQDNLHIQQILSEKVSGIHSKNVLSEEEIKYLIEVDTTIRVSYKEKDKKVIQPAYYVNGLFVKNLILLTINPNSIEEITVETGEFEKDNNRHSGKLHIKLKDWAEFKPITINKLKKEYLDLPYESSIIGIDNNLLNEYHDELVVNERNIYKIEVQRLQNGDENLNFINLITRTEKNIREAESPRIR